MLILMAMRLSGGLVRMLRWVGFALDLMIFLPLPYLTYLAGVDCERYNYGYSDGLGTFDHLRYGNYPFVFMAVGLTISVLAMFIELVTLIALQRNPPNKNESGWS